MSEHAPLAPSSAPQWGHCSGSVLAQADVPDYETEQSREGTAAHWVVAEVLQNYRDPNGARGPLLTEEYIGRTAPNGVVIDAKAADGASIIVHDVLQVCQQHGGLGSLLIEHRVFAPQLHADVWGTLDVALVLPHLGRIWLWDYKHGHRVHRAAGNLQLACYTAGLMNELSINGHDDQHWHVDMRIVQPFAYRPQGPVDGWAGALSDLRGTFNQLVQAAEQARRAPLLVPGLWCRDCTAIRRCPAARETCYNLIDAVQLPYDMEDMTGRDMAVERDILRDGIAVARARQEALEDELAHRIKQGDSTTGLTLEASRGRLVWAVPEQQAIALAAQFGVDNSRVAALTPKQTVTAAKSAVRPMLEAVLPSVTHRPAGKLTLVPVEDSRTARAFQPPKRG